VRNIEVGALAIASVLVSLGVLSMLSMSAAPVGAADNQTSGSMTASVAVVVDMTVTQWPDWGSLSKGADNTLADASEGNPLIVTIESTTNVVTDVTMWGSDNLEKSTGDYDYIGIENVVLDNTGGGSPSGDIYTLTNTETSGEPSWMQDIAVPGASDTAKNAYFYISTRDDQTAGDYTGTLYVKATGTA